MMCCPLAASLSRACAHASRSCSSRSTRTARSRPSHLWVQRGAENRILTPTTFLQQQQSCGFKRCRRACTGASLGGELSAVRRQFRSPHRSRKRVPKRSRKNSRSRKRAPNPSHKNSRSRKRAPKRSRKNSRSRKRAPNPSRKNSRSRRVKESFEPLRDSSAPAAPLNPPVLNELPERLQSATSSIRPSLEYGGVGLGAAGTLAAIPAARLAGEHRGPTPVDGQSEVYLYCQRPGGEGTCCYEQARLRPRTGCVFRDELPQCLPRQLEQPASPVPPAPRRRPTVPMPSPAEQLNQLTRECAKVKRELVSGPAVSERITAAKALPSTPELWTVSFTELPERLQSITVCIEGGNTSNGGTFVGSVSVCRDKPTTPFLVAAVLTAMTDPRPHFMYPSAQRRPPRRPEHILIAYRAADAFPEIADALFACGVACTLESKVDAKQTAQNHGTDYKGRNTSRCCATCGDAHDPEALSLCGGCREVWYCRGRDCQTADWPSHKRACKEAKRARQAVAAAADNDDDDDDDDGEEGGLVGQRLRVHGLKARPELNGSHGIALSFDAARGRYALQLCDLHGDHPGETILLRPDNVEPGVVWEVKEGPGRWVPFEPPDLQENIEGLFSMGSQHYLYRPGHPECEGKFERAALPGGCVGRNPPPACATHRIVFAEMRERALYLGTSRKVRRRGPPADTTVRDMFAAKGGAASSLHAMMAGLAP